MTIILRYLHPRATPDHVGEIPFMLNLNNPAPAREQLHQGYRHGGGWSPYGEADWQLLQNNVLQYPGDPPLQPLAEMHLRDERVVIYEHAVVAIIQADGRFEVARMD